MLMALLKKIALYIGLMIVWDLFLKEPIQESLSTTIGQGPLIFDWLVPFGAGILLTVIVYQEMKKKKRFE